MESESIIYWKQEQKNRKWRPIPNTVTEREEAIKNGAMFFTTTSLPEPYTGNGKPEPHRWGDFALDFDSDDIGLAWEQAVTLCTFHLPDLYDVDPYAIRYFLSGGKGFHSVIPAQLFDAAGGDTHLPLIYKKVAQRWKEQFGLSTLDLSLYCMARGRMLRIPNVKRKNGFYKVPLTLEEIKGLSPEQLTELGKAPREIEPVEVDLTPNSELSCLFKSYKSKVHNEIRDRTENPAPAPTVLSKHLPNCIRYILKHNPKTDKTTFNKLVIDLVTYFQAAGYSLDEAMSQVEGFLTSYPHSTAYTTPEARIKQFTDQWGYIEGNSKYAFDCTYILGKGFAGTGFDCTKCARDTRRKHKEKEMDTAPMKADVIAAEQDQKEKLNIRPAILENEEFLSLKLPEKTVYLDPWLVAQCILLISGFRGTGKTWLALSLLIAIAKRIAFGPWSVQNSVPCLYLDGEMAAQDVQLRTMQLDQTGEKENPLYIYSDAYASSLGLPRASLLNSDWRLTMKDILLELGVKVWVIDNLASLTPGIDENSKKDWDPINNWLLDLRFAGITTILLHHTNKAGGQRGTSAREDNIDISIMLNQPPGYSAEDGASFIMNFTKSRVATDKLSKIADTHSMLASFTIVTVKR